VSIYTQPIQGIYTALASAARTASQTIVGRTLIDPAYGTGYSGNGINPEASGIIAYLNVTVAPGVETLQLVLEEQDPVSGVWSTLAATTATTATGMVRLKMKQAIAAIAASTTQVQIQDTLPAIWRVRVVHSAAGSWTYSLGIVLYN
jgi:hypothetical protein